MSLALKASKQASGATFGGAFMPRSQFQGDPGLFGFLGKIARGAANVATGGISERIIGAVTQQTAPPAGPGAVSFPLPFQQQQTVPFPGPTRIQRIGQAIVPGGRTGFEAVGQPLAPAGHHLNKSDYWLKDGTFIEKGTRFVKNRRTNALNPRAASRAIRRIESAKKAVHSLDRISVKCRRCKKARCSCG